MSDLLNINLPLGLFAVSLIIRQVRLCMALYYAHRDKPKELGMP